MPSTYNTSKAAYDAAVQAWNDLATLRRRRLRCKDFTYGRQWADMVTTGNNHIMTEEKYARISGQMPHTNNIIRHLVKTVIGHWRESHADDPQPDDDHRRNMLDELDARMLEEFLISGCAVQRVTLERRPGRKTPEVWVDNVSPEHFFVNRYTDPRGADIELVGMTRDMSLTEALMRFGHGERQRRSMLMSALKACTGAGAFGSPAHGRCRIVEVWTLESCDYALCHDPVTGSFTAVDASRLEQMRTTGKTKRKRRDSRLNIRIETVLAWRCRWFTADGTLLDQTLSPYSHRCHPFAVKMFPLTDGEVHSFVEDVIDNQKNVNRLITLIDHIMGHSAKGVLLFPIECKVQELSWECIEQQWSSVNGIIPYRASSGDRPSQMVSNGSDAGAYRLLETQMQLLDRISGVGTAMRGQAATSYEGHQAFEARLRSEALALRDILGTFDSFVATRDLLMAGT